jgi:hypothetical protein
MCCVRVLLIAFVVLGGVVSGAPPVIADPENPALTMRPTAASVV